MLTCIDISNDDLGLGMRGYDGLPGTTFEPIEKVHQHDNIDHTNFGSGAGLNANSPVTGTAASEGVY